MQVIEKQVFLRRGAKLPQELRIHGSPINADWLALSENADVLDQQVREADWHFFRLTEEVRGWALAMSTESASEAALPERSDESKPRGMKLKWSMFVTARYSACVFAKCISALGTSNSVRFCIWRLRSASSLRLSRRRGRPASRSSPGKQRRKASSSLPRVANFRTAFLLPAQLMGSKIIKDQ